MSKRISGVKNLVSKIGAFSRVLPFIQPMSPTANGVWVSTSGPGSGASSASGTGLCVAAGLAPSGAAATCAAGTIITMSTRVALLAATATVAIVASGVPSACETTVQSPAGRSAKE